MPDLGVFHPQVVHFVIALGLVGVLLRLLSLFGRDTWLNAAAAVLILVGAGAAVIAVKSGTDAHPPAERIPGARTAVQEHEHWGHRTRNILLGVAGLEILGLLFGSGRAGRPLRFLSAAGGIAAAYGIIKVSDLGGDVVFEYAGGVGTRSGEPADVNHLLTAGLFHAAQLDRDSGRADDAARLIEELARRNPGDTTVRFLSIESKLRDQKDPAAALAELSQMQVPADDPRLAPRHGVLMAEALVALGRADSAKMVLTALAQRFPGSRSVQDALEKLP